MNAPTKAELIAILCELLATVEQMHSEYANDVAPGRAAAMEALRRHGFAVGQDCINRLDFDEIQRAQRKFPQPVVNIRELRSS